MECLPHSNLFIIVSSRSWICSSRIHPLPFTGLLLRVMCASLPFRSNFALQNFLARAPLIFHFTAPSHQGITIDLDFFLRSFAFPFYPSCSRVLQPFPRRPQILLLSAPPTVSCLPRRAGRFTRKGNLLTSRSPPPTRRRY